MGHFERDGSIAIETLTSASSSHESASNSEDFHLFNKTLTDGLNNLTRKTSTKFLKEIEIMIDTPAKLNIAAEAIVFVAISRPLLQNIITERLCKPLVRKKIVSENKDEKLTFRKFLLNCIQEKFESVLNDKSPLKPQRAISVCKLIGYLYKHEMINHAILKSCITSLLEKSDNKSNVSLCHLLNVILKENPEKLRALPISTYASELEKIFNENQDLQDESIISKVKVLLVSKGYLKVLEISKSSENSLDPLEGSSSATLPAGKFQIPTEISIKPTCESLTNDTKTTKARTNRLPKDTEDERLVHKFESLLKQLTLSNYFSIRDEIFESIEPKIKNEWGLRMCLRLIKRRAFTDPDNAAAYAQLLRNLSTVAVTKSSGFVLTMSRLFNWKKEKNFIKMKITEEGDDPEGYKKTLAKARFIGELYKCKQFMKNDVLLCLRHLFIHKSNCSIQCLVILLTAIGKHLTSVDEPLDDYFNYLKDIAERAASSVPDQIRSEINGLLELKEDYWI